jgi:hypothetical protein
MATINVTGNSSGGRFNIIRYNFDQPADLNTYNDSLCAVQATSNSLQTLQVYRPDSPINPFTQFLPGSGYIVFAKENFTLSGTELPPQQIINVTGNSSGGRFNIIRYNFDQPTGLSTYNDSLCAVQATSNSLQTLQVYRPDSPINPFTQFLPGSGYIVFAKENFTLSGTISSNFLTAINGDILLTIDGDNLVSI